MSTHYEKTFIQHLCIPESLKEIIESDLPDDLMPTDELGNIFLFAKDYWHADGRDGIAPTPEVMATHFFNLLAEHDIDLTIEPEATLSWTLAALQGAYIDRHWQPWVRDFAMKISSPETDVMLKAGYLDEAVQQLMGMQSKFTRRAEQVEVSQYGPIHLDAYNERANRDLSQVRGAILGIPMIDEQSGGIRDGEVAVVAGPPKSGKSYMLLNGAVQYWLAGGSPTLATLENSVEMTFDRKVCMLARVDYQRWDQGRCTPEELERIERYRELLAVERRPFHIIQPEPGKRTVEHLVRKAKSLGDALYIDQLTFIEPSPGSERKQRYQQVGDSLHELKSLISSGKRMPCILAHQINREGVKAAEKTGHLEMYHLAESAEVERTADRVYGLWQSDALRDVGRAWVQTLAARRSELVHWEIIWRPFIGQIEGRGRITLPEVA